jgi:hypothetical protein
VRPAIFCYPRTGSTLLYEIIKSHLSNIDKDYLFIGECFNPVSEKNIIEENGHIVSKDVLGSTPIQLRPERINLIKKYQHQKYFFKIFPYDISLPDIFNFCNQYLDTIILLDRKNPFDAVLSGVISSEYEFWNADINDDIPDYKPFVAPSASYMFMLQSISKYYAFRNKFTNKNIIHVYYEDMNNKNFWSDIAKIFSPDEDYNKIDGKRLPFRKLLSYEEKVKLVLNAEEIYDAFLEIVYPMIPFESEPELMKRY